MSLFYQLAYRTGIKPWEYAAQKEAATISALFDREERGREPPYGAALDIGCGTGMQAVELAKRGWDVTAVDIVEPALQAARKRAQDAGVSVRFVRADVAELRAAGVGSGFRFVLDFGCFHGLADGQRSAMAQEIAAVTDPGATLLMIAWAPGRRGPLPRGASREEIEDEFREWKVINADPLPASALPGFLKGADPHAYRLRRD